MSGPVEFEIPDGMSADAADTWPPRELIDSFLGTFDVGLWPGEEAAGPDDAAARAFRDTLARFCSGVTVVTSTSDGQPVGMTCQSFSSVSLHPPLVMFIPAKTSRAWAAIHRAGHFTVNFLAHDQQDVSTLFATRGVDKFAGVDWQPGTTGAPVLPGTLGHIDCTIDAVHEAGDHYLVVGRVKDLQIGADTDPLLFYRGAYTSTREKGTR